MLLEEKDRLILVAADDAEIRGYLEMALRCEGYGVEAVADGEEALNCFAMGMPISAVLLDVMLPGRDGL